MDVRGRRPSASIVSRCFERLSKKEAPTADISSQENFLNREH